MRFVLRKVAFYLVAAWVAATVDFLLPRLMPGNPVEAVITREQAQGYVSPSQIHALRILLGVGHGSLLANYGQYWANIVHLDFGLSLTYFPTPVSTIVAESLPWTIVLVGLAIVISAVVGTAFGILAGWKRGSRLDAVVPVSTFFYAVPYFWLALVLVYVLGTLGHVFPTSGGYNPNVTIGFSGAFIASAVYHGVLPALTIVVSSIAGWLVGMRNMMVTTLGEDYVVAAEARGLPSWQVMLTYASRNAILPQVTGFAIALGFVVSGAIVMEVVFSYPGIGYQLLQAVENNDYPLMQAIFLSISAAVLVANFLADLVYGYIDPRTRASR